MATAVQVFTLSMSSGTSFSSAMDLDLTPRWATLIVPSMASGSDVRIWASDSLSGTYRRMAYMGATGPALYTIASSVTDCAVPFPAYARFVKVQLSTATSNTAYTFKIVTGS